MPETTSQSNNKLTISPCKIDQWGNLTVGGSEKFEVMLNPASYKHYESIIYNKENALQSNEPDRKFSAIPPRKLDFNIIIDGTGVVTPSGHSDVTTQIDQLNNIVYKYQEKKREPSHVLILWGSLKFFGRLESMTINYSLFAPGGTPLRAEVALVFGSFLPAKQEALMKKNSLSYGTHIMTIKAGDTIPGLCHRIYGDGRYGEQVAKINDIDNLRDIKPGTKLIFPPLR